MINLTIDPPVIFQFPYGPIFLLYSIYDGIEDKESIIEQVEQHVERFSKMLLEKERTGMI